MLAYGPAAAADDDDVDDVDDVDAVAPVTGSGRPWLALPAGSACKAPCAPSALGLFLRLKDPRPQNLPGALTTSSAGGVKGLPSPSPSPAWDEGDAGFSVGDAGRMRGECLGEDACCRGDCA
jgi:hypothetical protein